MAKPMADNVTGKSDEGKELFSELFGDAAVPSVHLGYVPIEGDISECLHNEIMKTKKAGNNDSDYDGGAGFWEGWFECNTTPPARTLGILFLYGVL